MIHKAIERRSISRRAVYLICAGVALYFGLLSASMQDDLRGLIPFSGVAILCLTQFFRPTLLGWFALAGMFSAYTVSVALHFEPPLHQFVIFLLLGGIPFLLLLWAWPKSVVDASGTLPHPERR
jgi:hypothetical protein